MWGIWEEYFLGLGICDIQNKIHSYKANDCEQSQDSPERAGDHMGKGWGRVLSEGIHDRFLQALKTLMMSTIGILLAHTFACFSALLKVAHQSTFPLGYSRHLWRPTQLSVEVAIGRTKKQQSKCFRVRQVITESAKLQWLGTAKEKSKEVSSNFRGGRGTFN